MEWHIMQPRPACAGGVCTICLMGVSMRPAYRTAGSWQPPHHFEGLVPTVSCMYSMLLRYHWLYTSSWQRLQESDSMKNLLGIFPPPITWAELGKKAPFAPSPSCAISAGAISGLRITALFCHDSRVYQQNAPMPAMTTRQAARR